MSKFFLGMMVFINVLMIVSAQEKPINPNPAGQKDYSESTPYEPRQIDETRLPKKEKKSKLKSDGKVKSQTDEPVPAQPAASDARVKIPLFVSDAKGNPLTDLKNSEIKLLFNDSEQELLAIEPAGQALDIVLLVDTSYSTTLNPDDIRNFVTKLTESLKPEDKIQIISFNEELKILCDSTNDKEIIKKAIRKLKIGDGTSIYEAIETVFQKHLNSNTGEKTVILLSDGVDTTSLKADYISSLFAAEKNSTVVYSFYLDTFPLAQNYRVITPLDGSIFIRTNPGSTKDEYVLGFRYLQDITKLTGGRIFQIKNLAKVKSDELKKLLALLKPQYFVSFKSPGSDKMNQRKQMRLRINRPNLTVLARGSYITQ